MILTPGNLCGFQIMDKPLGNLEPNAAENIVPEPNHLEGSNLLTEASPTVNRKITHQKNNRDSQRNLSSDYRYYEHEVASDGIGEPTSVEDAMLSRLKEQHAHILHLSERTAEYENLTRACEQVISNCGSDGINGKDAKELRNALAMIFMSYNGYYSRSDSRQDQ